MARPGRTPDADRVLDRMSEMELAFIRPLGAFNTAMVDAYMDLMEEWTSFIARRVRQDARAMHQMLHCRDAAQVQKIQSAFFQRAADEYREEAARLNAILRSASHLDVQPDGHAARPAPE